jgi:isocitrate/isopropylmalate dehydrogenase
MLRWLDMPEVAERLGKAIRHVFVDQRIRTRDLGGTASTSEFTEAVVRAIGEAPEEVPA